MTATAENTLVRYEYKLLHFKVGIASSSGLPDDLNLRFDELGRGGWEYVEMKPVMSGGFFLLFVGIFSNTKRMVAVFKRPLD